MKVAYGQTDDGPFPGIFHGWPGSVIFGRANVHAFPLRWRAIPQIVANQPQYDRQYRVRQWCKLLDSVPHRPSRCLPCRKVGASLVYFPFLRSGSGARGCKSNLTILTAPAGISRRSRQRPKSIPKSSQRIIRIVALWETTNTLPVAYFFWISAIIL